MPETTKHFIPDWYVLADFKEKDEIHKKQKQNYDRAHRKRDIEPLPNDASVWVRRLRTENVV